MGTSIRFFWFLLIVSLCCLLHCSAASHEQQKKKTLRSAMVVGTVVCDTCFHQDFSKASHFISGASVAVECGDSTTKPSFRREAKTNRHGKFKVHLPPKMGRDIKACSVKLIKSSEPFCSVASSASTDQLRLKSRRNGVHIFSAGFFTFKPLNQPEQCYQKPDQSALFFPTPAIPFLPSPPNIGGIPLPPNPLLPPPSVLPPLPFVPSPPPFFSLPPIPLLTPPPPPPAFRFPPLPFPPNPLFPGIPPASSSKGGTP